MKLSFYDLKKKAIQEETLDIIKTVAAKSKIDVFTLMNFNAVFAVSKDDKDYSVEKFLVVNRNGNHVLWNAGGFYVADSSYRYYDDFHEAQTTANNINKKPELWGIKKDENAEIWNIVLQKWDKDGKEMTASIVSFTSEEAAIAKYYEWLGWDKNDQHVTNLKEDPRSISYTWNRGEEKHRCFVMKSHLFNE